LALRASADESIPALGTNAVNNVAKFLSSISAIQIGETYRELTVVSNMNGREVWNPGNCSRTCSGVFPAGCRFRDLMLRYWKVLANFIVKNANLSTEIQDPAAIPYFLWDEPMNVAQLKERLRGASRPERIRLLGKILREARDTDVWAFTSPHEVRQLWPEICVHLGRRRAFWEFLFTRWQIEGFLA